MLRQMLWRFVIPHARMGAEGAYKVPSFGSEHGRWRLVVTEGKEVDKIAVDSNERAWASRRAAILRSMTLDDEHKTCVDHTKCEDRLKTGSRSDNKEGRSDGVGTRRIVFESALASSQT